MNKRRLMILSVWALAVVAFVPRMSAWPGNLLNLAILTLPPKYLADIPLNQREELLKDLSFPDDGHRLDYEYGYLTYHSEESTINHSSVFYLKVLNGSNTAIFVHMQKPTAGHKPAKSDTYVLAFAGDEWIDITDKVLPKSVDRKSYFNPLRKSEDVEVAPWVKRTGMDEYEHGLCNTILRWDGSTFKKIAVRPRDVTNGFDTERR